MICDLSHQEAVFRDAASRRKRLPTDFEAVVQQGACRTFFFLKGHRLIWTHNEKKELDINSFMEFDNFTIHIYFLLLFYST